MARLMRWMLLALILSLAFLGVFEQSFTAAAQTEDDDDDGLTFEDEDDTADLYGDEEEGFDFDLEDEEWEIGPSPDVRTAFWFPEYSPEHVFPLGKPLDVVVNLRNEGPQTFNVSYVQVAFRSPFDLSFYIQNFTAKPVAAVLGPDQELNIEYTFFPEPSLDPTKFWMTGYVGFSNSAGRQFQQTWADKTVEMVAGDFKFDLTSVLQYGLLLAIAAGGGYLALARLSPQSGTSRGASKKTSVGARRGGKGKGRSSGGAAADDDAGSGGWDEAFYTAEKASKSVRRRNKKSK